MCGICGCGEGANVRVSSMSGGPDGGSTDDAPHDHVDHSHSHGGNDHAHDHGHGHPATVTAAAGPEPEELRGDDAGRTVILERRILAKNDLLAERNRDWLRGRGTVALNLMSSPGSGKTTLLERSIRDLSDEFSVSVIEGDQETPLDAERIRATGRPVVQINTGAGCHLDASMVAQALGALDPPTSSVVFIENVGNLVCPALFDLGERARVVIISVTEGADKPRKYPQMFAAAELVVLNKVDLLPHLNFDVDEFRAAVATVNPGVEIMPLSATTGEGVDSWYRWLRNLEP